jgi:hypothetical protein
MKQQNAYSHQLDEGQLGLGSPATAVRLQMRRPVSIEGLRHGAAAQLGAPAHFSDESKYLRMGSTRQGIR